MTTTATAPPRPRRPSRAAGASRPPTPQAADDVVSGFASVFAMVSFVCLWTAAQLIFLGGISQARAQELLYDELRGQLASATAPIGPDVPVGEPVAVLSIPAVDLEQVVVEGTAGADLLTGPGHRRDTVLPGQAGVSVIYGRASTYGAPFADLVVLQPGDPITVVTGQGEKTFEVLRLRREGDPLPQPLATGAARLTLVSAEGAGRLGALRPGETVYVDAEATEAFPTQARPPVAVPPSEQAMGTDPGAVPLLSLCLAALLALTAGVVAARQRWSAALVWVIASPAALALSWMSTDVVMRLLPNLI